jgi:hypothetical protein
LTIYIPGLVAHDRIRRIERIRISPEWLEREAGKRSRSAPVHCIFARNLPRVPGLNAKDTFGFLRVLANSHVELNRNGQLMPDQPSVSKNLKKFSYPSTLRAYCPEAKKETCRSGPGRKIR